MDKLFKHSGKLGDIIYSLPTIRAMGGGTLLLHDNPAIGHRLPPEMRNSIAQLLRMQPYITAVEDYQGQPDAVDLDVFRRRPITENLAEQHLRSFDLDPALKDRRWLCVDRPELLAGKAVVFHRSDGLHNPDFPWADIYQKYGHVAVFVGTPAEHEQFVEEFGPIDYHPTETLADLARSIAGCRLFVGNQSCPYAIAEGLGIDTIQETHPEYPNCLFLRENAIFGRAEPFELPGVPPVHNAGTEFLLQDDILRAPIFGFIHVAMVNHWQQIVDEQVLKLRASGLWDKTERLFVGLLGPRPDEFPLTDPKILPMYFGVDYTPAERPTLAALQWFCRTRDCMVYYIHTKGVFSPANGTRDWRHSMEHFIITRHQDCIAALSEHDICGINWHSSWCRFFGGNFWWARSDYVRSLPDIRSLEPIPGRDHSPRHVCERWVGENPAVRAISLHESRTHHYRDEYPRSRYAHVREVAPSAAFDCPSAWKGLEDRFQDLIEPVAPVRRVVVIGVEFGLSLFALAGALPQATIIGIEPAADREDSSEGPSPRRWLDSHLAEFPNALLLRTDAAAAAQALNGKIDVLLIDAVASHDDLGRTFDEWLPKLQSSGCLLLHGTLSLPDDVGKFFRGLPGRKAEIRQGSGLGAWYGASG